MGENQRMMLIPQPAYSPYNKGISINKFELEPDESKLFPAVAYSIVNHDPNNRIWQQIVLNIQGMSTQEQFLSPTLDHSAIEWQKALILVNEIIDPYIRSLSPEELDAFISQMCPYFNIDPSVVQTMTYHARMDMASTLFSLKATLFAQGITTPITLDLVDIPDTVSHLMPPDTLYQIASSVELSRLIAQSEKDIIDLRRSYTPKVLQREIDRIQRKLVSLPKYHFKDSYLRKELQPRLQQLLDQTESHLIHEQLEIINQANKNKQILNAYQRNEIENADLGLYGRRLQRDAFGKRTFSIYQAMSLLTIPPYSQNQATSILYWSENGFISTQEAKRLAQ